MAVITGFVPFTNVLDLSALDKHEPISNEELKEIFVQIHRILEATTLAASQTKRIEATLPIIITEYADRIVLHH